MGFQALRERNDRGPIAASGRESFQRGKYCEYHCSVVNAQEYRVNRSLLNKYIKVVW